MKKFLTTIILLAALQSAQAQEFKGNAFGEGMSNAMTSESGFNSIGYNPAGIYSSDLGFGISYNSRYCMKELSQKSATMAIPVSKGCFSASFDYFGFELFNKSQAGIGYGMKLNKEIKAGVKVNYHNLHIDDTPEKFQTVTGEVGVIYTPVKSLDIGAYVTNITNSQFNETDTNLVTSVCFGLKYRFYNEGSFNIDFEKNSLKENIQVRIGVEGKIIKHVSIMGGCAAKPFNASMGIAFDFDQLKVIVTTHSNRYLGWTPIVSIVWNRNRKPIN